MNSNGIKPNPPISRPPRLDISPPEQQLPYPTAPGNTPYFTTQQQPPYPPPPTAGGSAPYPTQSAPYPSQPMTPPYPSGSQPRTTE